ncbi:O-antigen ligase family protein [Clostridium sp.]|uniref:O-antigen ligase family protein n=1 Tax=Clostridium sp. TaxID=1506 RepID=UPI003D6D45B2
MINILEILAVLWIIISSGSVFFTIVRMQVTMGILFLIAVIYLMKNGRISERNLYIFFSITIILIINIIINIDYDIALTDTIIIFIKLFSLMVIQSNISMDKFKKYFINIMAALCLISDICFGILTVIPNFKLPLLMESFRGFNQYIYTFYYTMSWTKDYQRNSGIFWEPGAYQVFIIIAIILLMHKREKDKYRIHKFILFSITLITTFSVTGYVCYIIALLYSFFMDKSYRKENFKIKVLSLILIGIMVFIEINFNIMGHKLVAKEGSYNTRYNDTVSSLTVISGKPLTGYGVSNKYVRNNMENKYGVVHNSNGLLISFYDLGIPIMLLYLYFFYKGQRDIFGNKGLASIYTFSLFLIFFNSESLIPMTLFISFIFKWED